MSIDRKAGMVYGIHDPGLGEFKILTNVVNFESSGLPLKTAIFVSDDTGEGKTTSPVAFELARRGWGVTAIVRGPSVGIYSSDPRFLEAGNFDPEVSFDGLKIKADAVVAGGSTVSAMQAWATAWGNENGSLTLGMGDYPGDHVDTRSKGFVGNPLSVPKFMTAMDERTEEYESARFAALSLPTEHTPTFIRTGQTNLDPLTYFNRSEAIERVRREQQIPNVDIYTYFGSKGFSTVESLKIAIEALKDVNPNNGEWMLGLRLHPGDKENIESGAYARALYPIANRVIDLMGPKVPNVLDAIAISKVVLQERSTTALEAAAMDVAVGSIVHPYLVERSTIPAGLWVPTNSDQTSPMAHNLEEMRDLIARFDNDGSFTDALRRRRVHYRQDGQAYLRVADFIEVNSPR